MGGCRPFTIYNYDSPITINYEPNNYERFTPLAALVW